MLKIMKLNQIKLIKWVSFARKLLEKSEKVGSSIIELKRFFKRIFHIFVKLCRQFVGKLNTIKD